jgi:hypothetical protein
MSDEELYTDQDADGQQAGGIGLLVSAFASFGSKLDDMSSAIARPTSTPLVKPKVKAANFGAATTGQIVIDDDASPGWYWNVFRVGIFGNDGHTSVPGAIADVFISGTAANVTGAIDFGGQIYSALPIPSIVEDNDGHNPVMQGERVYALVYNVPANQNLVLAVAVYERPIVGNLAMSIPRQVRPS